MLPELEGHPWPTGTRVIWTAHVSSLRATVLRSREIPGSGVNYTIKPDGDRYGDEYVWHDEIEKLNALELLAELESSDE